MCAVSGEGNRFRTFFLVASIDRGVPVTLGGGGGPEAVLTWGNGEIGAEAFFRSLSPYLVFGGTRETDNVPDILDVPRNRGNIGTGTETIPVMVKTRFSSLEGYFFGDGCVPVGTGALIVI